jgi:hypothetical protein
MTGKQNRKMQARYIITNTAPPFWPARYGKRQMLLRPMADPVAASMKPRRPVKLPLLDIV